MLSFVVSFCIGICVMLCLVPKPTVVIKFPRPDTSDDEYRAPDGSCFKVTPRRVGCDKSANVLPQPVTNYSPSTTDNGLEFRNPFQPASGT